LRLFPHRAAIWLASAPYWTAMIPVFLRIGRQ